MRDVQAIRTLRSVATLQLWAAILLGGLVVLFLGLLERSGGIDSFDGTTLRFVFNLPGVTVGLIIVLAGLLFWAVCEVLASMATSLLTVRDYYERKLEEEYPDEYAGEDEELD